MTQNCLEPAVGNLLASYELGLLDADERRTVEAHLAVCEVCLADAYDTAPLATVMTAEARSIGEKVRRATILDRVRAMVSRPATLVPAAAVAVLALVLVLRPGTLDPRDVARIEPLPWVPLALRDARTDDAAALFTRGMERYAENDWTGAIADLREAVERETAPLPAARRDQAHLYLGMSLLLSGDPDAARGPLTEAMRSAIPVVADRARWVLAQAHLARGDADAASVLLRELDESPGYADAADGQLRRLGRRR